MYYERSKSGKSIGLAMFKKTDKWGPESGDQAKPPRPISRMSSRVLSRQEHCEKYLGCYVERTARSVTLTEIIDSHA